MHINYGNMVKTFGIFCLFVFLFFIIIFVVALLCLLFILLFFSCVSVDWLLFIVQSAVFLPFYKCSPTPLSINNAH